MSGAADTEAANSELRERLARLVAGDGRDDAPLDAVVTHIEVNDHHGVGALVRRIFAADGDVLSIRSADHFGGEQRFGRHALRLAHDPARASAYANVVAKLPPVALRGIVCIPYYVDDVRTGIALKDVHGVPMCTYLMDDQNVHADGIPDAWMRELLAKSDLRLAISAELRDAYEAKFGLRCWVVPPTVARELVLDTPRTPPREVLRARRGAIVGNIWGKRWLALLRATVRGSGLELDWYCNSGVRWLGCTTEELAADGIHARGALDDPQLVADLRERPFVLLPSGTLDAQDDRRFIAELSLPSRIPYVFATSHTPIVVLGHERTAAARFVAATGLGCVAPYDRARLLQAVDHVVRPEVQEQIRRRAAELAPRFVVEGVREWIRRSMEAGEAMDDRFERLLPRALDARSACS